MSAEDYIFEDEDFFGDRPFMEPNRNDRRSFLLDSNQPLVHQTEKAWLLHFEGLGLCWVPKSVATPSYSQDREENYILIPTWFNLKPAESKPAKKPQEPIPPHLTPGKELNEEQMEIQKLYDWHIKEAERLRKLLP